MKRPSRRLLLVLCASLAVESTAAHGLWDSLPSVSAFLNNSMSFMMNTDVAVNNVPIFGNLSGRIHLSGVQNDRRPAAVPGSEPAKRVANTGDDAAARTDGTRWRDDGDDVTEGDAARWSSARPDVAVTTTESPARSAERAYGDAACRDDGAYADRGYVSDGPQRTSAARRIPATGANPFADTGLNPVYERMVQDVDYRMINDVGRTLNCFYCTAAAFRGCTVSALADAYGVDPATAVLDADSVDRLLAVFKVVKSPSARGQWYRDYMTLWNFLDERTGPGGSGAYALAYDDVHGIGQVVALRVWKENVRNARMNVLVVDYSVPAAPDEPLSGRFRTTIPSSDAYYLFVFYGAHPSARPAAENALPTNGEDGAQWSKIKKKWPKLNMAPNSPK